LRLNMNDRRKSSSRPRRGAVIIALDIVLAATGMAAVAALVLEYGFREPLPVPRHLLYAAEAVIVAIFVLDRFARLALAQWRWGYFRQNWIDFALISAAAAAAAASYRLRGRGGVVSAGALYVIITQVYILAALLIRGVNMNLQFAGSGIHPTWLLIGSFVFTILIGSGLLMLPAATPPPTSENYVELYYADALFTATSATCVTGLIVRDTGLEFTRFGQGVILCLIQLGGLGIMIFGTMLAAMMGKSLSLRGTNALGQMLATDRPGDMGRVTRFVVVTTLIVEAIGAAMFYPMFASQRGADGAALSSAGAVWNSLFHSISSFCNAGFALYGRNMMQGVGQAGWGRPLRDHWQIVGVMAPLIILGGVGFPVLRDLGVCGGAFVRRSIGRWGRTGRGIARTARARLSLHSKIVLATSAALLILGAAVLLAVEPRRGGSTRQGAIGRHPIYLSDGTRRTGGDWGSMSLPRRVREAAFQSVTARTAGFNTIDMGELSDAGKLWMCGLMIIGGSPASTAGGMKTVTLALLVITAACVIRKRNEVEVFRRSIGAELLRRTVTLAVLYMSLVVTVTLLLCVAMRPGYSFIDLFFEACSACGTVGLSTGVTGGLSLFGKYVILAAMFAGRLGPLTLLLAATSGIRRVRYAYPAESVVIG